MLVIVHTAVALSTLPFVFFFVQELVESGKIAVRYIPTQNQLADLGTKFLATPRFRELVSKIQAFGDNATD